MGASPGSSRRFYRTPHRLLACACAGLVTLGSAVTALGDDRRAAIESITVTARKRPESADAIPVSISVLGRDDLREQEIQRTRDLALPNLEIASTVGLGNSGRATLRGVGQFDVSLTNDPGVGIYLDGVYLARPQSGLLALADLERVEVLRGPQGTLFGKNTIGGALSLITAQPDFEPGGEVVLRYGDYDALETRVVLNAPLVAERAALRLSLATTSRDGFYDEVSGGSDAGDDRLLAGRIALRLLPHPSVELAMTADLSIENKVPQPPTCLPTANISGPTTAIGMIDSVNQLLTPDTPQRGPEFRSACSESAAFEGRRRFRSDLSFLKDELDSFGVAATLSVDLGDSTRLTSITASRGLRSRLRADFDGTAVPLVTQEDVGDFAQDQLSQEIQLSTRWLEGRLRGIAGLYGFREKIVNTGVGPDGPGLAIATRIETENGAPGFAAQPFAGVLNELRSGSLSYAAYGQVSFDVTPELEATLGLRFTHERKRFFRDATVASPGVALSLFDGASADLLAQLTPQPSGATIARFDRSERFRDFTPQASLTYRIDPRLLVYASYATGFKSGTFDSREVAAASEVDPEELTTYELGVKAMPFDGRMRVSLAAFHSIYRHVQLTITTGDPADPTDVLNAAKAIIRGGELELDWLANENLRLSASLGVLRTRYPRFDEVALAASSGSSELAPLDSDDLELPFSPSYTMRFAARYSLPLRSAIVSFGGEWLHKGAQSLDVLNTEQLEQGKYGELRARIGVESNDGRYAVAVYGRNLLDREYAVSGFDQGQTTGFVGRFLGPPRTYGVELRVRF